LELGYLEPGVFELDVEHTRDVSSEHDVDASSGCQVAFDVIAVDVKLFVDVVRDAQGDGLADIDLDPFHAARDPAARDADFRHDARRGC
jgi:hypothetical protein